MFESLRRGFSGDVCAVVRVNRGTLETECTNYGKYPAFGDLNPLMAFSSRLAKLLQANLEQERFFLTAQNNGGKIELFVDGEPLEMGRHEFTELGLGLAVRSFAPKKITDSEKAEGIAKKMLRGNKSLLLCVNP